ncbi:hypothetical protein QOZ80_7AG0552090 [Eleusine coracana subsp. coracana]|nr:hypothetical protein QOZ80_7AG0552090 [Eleusine coracana subsp. coracana]
MGSIMVSTKKVCVVGAGVSGLVAARELRREGHAVTVLEQNDGVGGQWLYDPKVDPGEPLGLAGVHSGIYASLRLIVPREVMSFSDFPFYPRDGGDGRRYPGHGEFLRYIREFCDVFGVMDAVRLNTTVLRVAAMANDGSLRWTVRSCTRRGENDDDVITTEEEEWTIREGGTCTPTLDLSKVAMEVHISVKSVDDVAAGMRKTVSRHHNLHLRPQIDCLCEDGTVVFADGARVVADSVIYCTGYNYSYPFLDTGSVVTVDDNRVGPLFEHTFPPALAPELSFVGVPKKVVVPRFYEVQAKWVAQVLSGRRRLPPVEQMLSSVEEYHRTQEAAGVPKQFSHDLWDIEYCDEFGEKHCGFPRLPEWKKELMLSSIRNMYDDHENFRNKNYEDSELAREGLRSEGWLPDAERS